MCKIYKLSNSTQLFSYKQFLTNNNSLKIHFIISLYITMLRNRKRRDTVTIPFRIRNNFRRQTQGTTVPGSSDDNDNFSEIVDFNDHDHDIDMIQSPSVSEEEYVDDDYTTLSGSEDDDYTALSGSEDDDYTTSLESVLENNTSSLSEEKLFVDEALDEGNLPHYNGNFAPYFQDFTTAALFCWIHKHNISTNAYEDLVDIIMNQEFDRNHIVKNIRRFRTWRQHLPLLPISAKSISISSKKTPSTSKDSKIAYQISINDIIWHVLNNPSLTENMYFGPGIDSETKSEYWHGTLWAESPLFGKEQLTILQGNDYICLFDSS